MLKATTVIAGAKIATILVGIVRMKAIASLLGPGGLGLVNLVSSPIEFIRVITNLGIDSAVIRSIAEASAKDDSQKLAIIYRVAFRIAIVIGLVGWGAISFLSPWLSQAATGSKDSAWLFVLGGASLAFTPLLGVQLGVLQGLRKIASLAKCQMVSSPVAAAITILLIFLYGETGGVAALAASSLSSLAIHYRFLRAWRPSSRIIGVIPYGAIIRDYLKDGSGFAINGLWLTASGWLNLLLIRNYYGDQGVLHVGLYSAASMLANFYIGIIISALASEIYPSLVAEVQEPKKMRQLLNQQGQFALDAGVFATLVLIIAAPHALTVLYSAKFSAAADLMRLLLCGTAIRFAAFPLGFAILALGRSRLFALCELAMGVTTISLSYYCITQYGLMGLGVALIVANLIQVGGLWMVTSKLDMSWDKTMGYSIIIAFISLALILWLSLSGPSILAYITSSAIAAIYGLVAARRMQRSLGMNLRTLFRKPVNSTTK